MAIIGSKKLNDIEKKLEEIEKLLDTNIVYKASKYEELKKYLSNIKFDVNINKKINDLGNYDYIITYTLPEVILKFDDFGNLIDNPRFTSINFLDLVSLDDMNKFSRIIAFEKERNRKS